MKHIVVTEGYNAIAIKKNKSDCLTPEEADELALHAEIKGLDQDNIIIGRSEVKFINYVGYIRLSTCSIEILPKVHGNDLVKSRSVLIRLLNRSGFTNIKESELGEISLLNENLLEIIGFMFIKKLSKETKKGLYQYYLEEIDNLDRVRGKINFKEQILNSANRSTRVSCQYDNFTSNTILNQVFKETIIKLIRSTFYLETQRLLRHEIGIFEEVSLPTITPYVLKSVKFNRNNQRFYESFLLAKLILTNLTSTTMNGPNQNFSILFKMNELFETYVAFLVKKIVPNAVIKERKFKLLVNEKTGRKNFILEPDIVIPNEQLIIDTKWKRYDPLNSHHGVQREDLYQMYAYLTRYKDVNTVVILYPYGFTESYKSGDCLNTWHLEENTSKKIKCYTINFEDEMEALRELQAIITFNL
jgi:5-methylcytosine-specific restriction enzyme subunit McrC